MKKRPDKATALITGASSGMGYEYALQLAAVHYDLVLVSNEEEKLTVLSEELQQKYNIKTWAFYTDLARTDAANNVYKFCQNKNIEIDILINNAGMFFFGEVVNTKPDLVLKKTLLHVVTPTMLCALFGRDMKFRRKGYILNMSSISAYMPYPGIAIYASTKAYLKCFSRALRSEMIDYNVSVTYVCPGAVATNLFDRDKIDYKKAMRLGIMMTAQKVVRIGLRAMFRRKARIIPGILNRITVFLVRITPAGFILFIKRNSKLLPADK
jgi:short-subunit dehydrogenase